MTNEVITQLLEEEFKSPTLAVTTQYLEVHRPVYINGELSESFYKIVPNPEPEDFEDKLIKLLDYLEQDKEGIKELVEKANGYIQVAMDLHNENSMIGGANLSADCIRRMSNLGLAIDFDLYVAGNSFKE
jgi:hypothetical protein